MIRVIVSTTGSAHGEIGCAVKLIIAWPAVISAALGVKVGVNVFALANTPPPLELQLKLLSFDTLAILAKKINSSPSHIVLSPPTETTGCGAIVMITSSVAGVAHGVIG